MPQDSLTPSGPPPRRIFLGWERSPLPAATEVLVERALAAPGDGARDRVRRLDLSRVRVVVPGGRARRRLQELLVEEAGRRGLPLLPPEVVTVGGMAEGLYTPTLPIAPPEVEAAAWREALRPLPASDIGLLLPEPPAPERVVAWDGLADTLRTLQGEVGREGLTFADVRRRCGDGLLFDDEARWAVLAAVQEEARRLLAAGGWTDREAARAGALESPHSGLPPLSGAPSAIVLVGIVELAGVVRQLLAASGIPVVALVHAPPALAHRFDAWGAVLPEAWEGERLPLPPRSLRIVTRPQAQGEAVVDRLRELEGRFTAEEVSIGVPDATLIPPLAGALARAGVPTRTAAGEPVARTAPFRLLRAVADFLEARDFPALEALVRHPALTRALNLPFSLPGVVDAWSAFHLPATLGTAGLPSGGEGFGEGVEDWVRRPHGAMVQLRDALDALLHGAGVAGGESAPLLPLAEWAPRLRALITGLYPDAGGVDDEEPTGEARTLAAFARAAGRVLEGFEALRAPLDGERVGAPEAITLLLSGVRGEKIPAPTDPGAIELLGWLELHMDDAPVLIVTGVNEPALPETVPPEPFLPQALRGRLGLPDQAARRARDHYLLQALLASRPETLLISGRRDAEGAPQRMSRLLLADDGATVAHRLRLFLEPPTEAARGLVAEGTGEESPSPDAPSTLRFPPEPVLETPSPVETLRVTDFRTLLENPYLFALRRLLRLDAVTGGAHELDPLHFGGLAHVVLETWGRMEGAGQMPEPRIIAALDRILDAEVKHRYGAHPLAAVEIQREQLRARLRRFARAQAARNAAGWEIISVEVGDNRVPFPVDGTPFFLSGRMDRVDYHPEHGWALLDYKTSEKAQKPDETHGGAEEGWADLQLPLYRHLFAHLRAQKVPALQGPRITPQAPVRMGYILLSADAGDEAGSGVFAMAEWDAAALQDADEAAAEVIRRVRTGRFIFDPQAGGIWPDDPLSVLLGKGVLQDDQDESEGGIDA